MKELNIYYSPVTYELKIHSNFDYTKTSFEDFINLQKGKRERIFNWTNEAFSKFSESLNEKKFKVNIRCDEFEKQEIVRQIEFLGQGKDSNKLSIEHSFEIFDTDKSYRSFQDFENFLLNNSDKFLRVETDKIKESIAKIHKQEVNIAVAATMSAGKSTLLNALIGKTLLPSKNEATTATLCKIKINNSLDSFQGRIVGIDPEIQEKNIDENWISEYNEKANDPNSKLEILLEGPVSDFDTFGMNVSFIDTPGPNNSQNNKHREATYTYLKDEKNKPILMYVLNATQLRTNDEQDTLKEISDYLNGHKNSYDRIIFVLNRIDDLDPDKESLGYKITKTKEYLSENFGIKNPKIFPISAEYGRLAIKFAKGEVLSRNERSNLKNFKEKFIPCLEENFEGIPVFDYLPVSIDFKNQVKSYLGESEDKDNLIYSGVFGLKAYLQYYIKHQQRNELLHSLHEVFTDFMSTMTSKISIEIDPNKIVSKKKEFDDLKNSKQSEIESTLSELDDSLKKVSMDLSFSDNIAVELQKKIAKIQHPLNGQPDEIEIEKAKGIERDISKELNYLIRSIKTTFESSTNSTIYKCLHELKSLTKEKFKEFNHDSNQFIELLHYELDLKVSTINTEELLESKSFSKEVLIKDNTKWYNPFSWGGRFDEYKSERRIKKNVFNDLIIDPESKRLTSALKTSTDDLKNKQEKILEKFLEIIFNHAEITLKEITSKYEESFKETESEFKSRKERLNKLKLSLKSNFNKIRI